MCPRRSDAVGHACADRTGVHVRAGDAARKRGPVLLEWSYKQVPRSPLERGGGCRVEEGDQLGVGERENLDRLVERPVGLDRDVNGEFHGQAGGSGRVSHPAGQRSVDRHLD